MSVTDEPHDTVAVDAIIVKVVLLLTAILCVALLIHVPLPDNTVYVVLLVGDTIMLDVVPPVLHV